MADARVRLPLTEGPIDPRLEDRAHRHQLLRDPSGLWWSRAGDRPALVWCGSHCWYWAPEYELEALQGSRAFDTEEQALEAALNWLDARVSEGETGQVHRALQVLNRVSLSQLDVPDYQQSDLRDLQYEIDGARGLLRDALLGTLRTVPPEQALQILLDQADDDAVYSEQLLQRVRAVVRRHPELLGQRIAKPWKKISEIAWGLYPIGIDPQLPAHKWIGWIVQHNPELYTYTVRVTDPHLWERNPSSAETPTAPAGSPQRAGAATSLPEARQEVEALLPDWVVLSGDFPEQDPGTSPRNGIPEHDRLLRRMRRVGMNPRRVARPDPCWNCGGSGQLLQNVLESTCPACDGTGRFPPLGERPADDTNSGGG